MHQRGRGVFQTDGRSLEFAGASESVAASAEQRAMEVIAAWKAYGCTLTEEDRARRTVTLSTRLSSLHPETPLDLEERR